jgi:hypothetical protein
MGYQPPERRQAARDIQAELDQWQALQDPDHPARMDDPCFDMYLKGILAGYGNSLVILQGPPLTTPN